MNRIVREHYPVEKLPEDLRVGLNPRGKATVTIITDSVQPPQRLLDAMDAPDRPRRAKDEIDALTKLIRSE
jgi:hypothetical protein